MAASSRSAADGAGGVGDSPVLWSGEKKLAVGLVIWSNIANFVN